MTGHYIIVVHNNMYECAMSCSTEKEAREVIASWKKHGVSCFYSSIYLRREVK